MTTGNPGYSPLPQSNSDSDGSEEEELHTSQGSKFSSRPVDVEVSKSAETVIKKNNVIKYKPLDDERHVEETLSKYRTGLDEVLIKKSSSSEKFSTFRKIGFVFSLFLCVFTTVAFIWILPCNIESCPVVEDVKSLVPSDSKNGNYTWRKILPNLEIIGPCSLVSDSLSRNQNLVFLAKNHSSLDEENYLLSLKGRNGSINWSVKFEKESTVVDCRLIDIDLDGLNDCLLFGSNHITAINSDKGKEVWSSQNLKKGIELTFLNFPVVLPDIDNDGVKDLLFFYSISNSSQKAIAVVSGKTGKDLDKPYQIDFCETFHTLVPSNSTVLFFTCQNLTKESVYEVNLTDAFKTVRNVSRGKVNFSNWEKLQHQDNYSNTVFLNSLQLVLENTGNCPETCSVLVSIKTKLKGSSGKSFYTLKKKNAYGMTPVKFNSKHSSGFILKFWEWNEEIEKNKNLNSMTDLDQETLLEDKPSVKRCKRTVNNFHRAVNETNLRLITETLVKITLSDTHHNFTSMYKREIIQICQKPHVCHPDVHQQRHSTLVACFNGNEREKVVTFTSENIKSSISKSWQMQSEIKMFDCE